MAIEDLLGKLAKLFSKPKSQTIFLINNYDMIITILKVISSVRMLTLFTLQGLKIGHICVQIIKKKLEDYFVPLHYRTSFTQSPEPYFSELRQISNYPSVLERVRKKGCFGI